ncbi:hypothetical protein [Sphingomonas sp.]|uniref:hypothetical protein n=1 Tax=Sphingomonas sp. TaxID=28214 RepID=UPI003CC55CEA
MERIRLLCTCGAGLEAIASPLTHSVRDLIGADSESIFWVDAQGLPAGFYCDTAPADLKNLFIVGFAELFDRSDEVNMRT